MIVSHKHRFIFLKTRKTAGTSLEIALSRFCGPDDLLTPLHPEDEELRREVGGRGPQHCESLPPPAKAWSHMQARRVRRIVGPRMWREYFTFCVERDPWEVVLSSYHLSRARLGVPEDLTAMVNNPHRMRKLAQNQDVYRINGEIAVDKVCRYENLREELTEVWARVGLSLPVELPSAKSSHRTSRQRPAEEFTDEDAERVRVAFSVTIRDFGYQL